MGLGATVVFNRGNPFRPPWQMTRSSHPVLRTVLYEYIQSCGISSTPPLPSRRPQRLLMDVSTYQFSRSTHHNCTKSPTCS